MMDTAEQKVAKAAEKMKKEHNGFNFFNLREIIFLQVLLKMNPM